MAALCESERSAVRNSSSASWIASAASVDRSLRQGRLYDGLALLTGRDWLVSERAQAFRRRRQTLKFGFRFRRDKSNATLVNQAYEAIAGYPAVNHARTWVELTSLGVDGIGRSDSRQAKEYQY